MYVGTGSFFINSDPESLHFWLTLEVRVFISHLSAPYLLSSKDKSCCTLAESNPCLLLFLDLNSKNEPSSSFGNRTSTSCNAKAYASLEGILITLIPLMQLSGSCFVSWPTESFLADSSAIASSILANLLSMASNFWAMLTRRSYRTEEVVL